LGAVLANGAIHDDFEGGFLAGSGTGVRSGKKRDAGDSNMTEGWGVAEMVPGLCSGFCIWGTMLAG